MDYKYVIKSYLGVEKIGEDDFSQVKKVSLFSPKDIKFFYEKMLKENGNAKILKRTSKGWVPLDVKDVEKEIPRGHKKAYKVAI